MKRIAELMLACAAFSFTLTDANAQIRIGEAAVVLDETGLAFGNASYSGGVDASAIGDTSTAGTDNTTAIGAHSRAMAASATSLGHAAQAIAFESLALGANSMANFSNSVALGAGSTTLFGAQSGYAAFGLDASQTSSGEVNVGNRTISGVAAGRVDQDAVNVAQLQAVASRIDGAVMYDRNPDGTINDGSVTLQGDPANGGTRVRNVADAVDAHDAVNLGQLSALLDSAAGNVTVNTSNPMFSSEGLPATEPAVASGAHSIAAGANAHANGANAVALGAGSNASADNAVALGQGSVADRANTVSVGAAGQERQITNVAAGVQGTDAVNVSQLNQSVSSAVGRAKSYTDDQVRSVRKDGYGGAAAAIAMAGLPQAVLPGRGMVALAAGTYGGQSAMAVGVSQLSDTGKWVYKLQGTASSRGEVGASIGAGMHW
ncbi:YadA family autotransporter adhesin [Paraburkholderia diazotrophica]|uniref:YadA family autotransporter adhesin n=1 Tax=Paraburkholderia diazotrophica TaxID=667676 RepID=UPI003173B2B1